MKVLRLATLAGMTVLCLTALRASAEDFPARSIRLVVGFSAGGGSDLVARILARTLTDKLGRAVIVENRPGAGGMVAPGSSLTKSRTAIRCCWAAPPHLSSTLISRRM